MAQKINRWINSKTEEEEEDFDDEEHDDDADEEMDDDDDDSTEEEEEEPKQKTIIDYIDEIVEEEWSGSMEKDVGSIKDSFHKYLLSVGILKTKFFKQFQNQLQEEVRTLKSRYAQDGVSKDKTKIEQTAYDEAFESFIPRIEDIVQELYRRYNIKEEEEQTTSSSLKYGAWQYFFIFLVLSQWILFMQSRRKPIGFKEKSMLLQNYVPQN